MNGSWMVILEIEDCEPELKLKGIQDMIDLPLIQIYMVYHVNLHFTRYEAYLAQIK